LFYFLCINQFFGQVKYCGKIDTTITLCYIKEYYSTSKFAIEKKWESEDDILQSQTTLLADLDGDCFPELLIGGINANQFCIYIINPISGITIKKIDFPFYDYTSPLPFAVADVDNDGDIELVIAVNKYSPTPLNLLGKLVCVNLDGTLNWISDQRYDIGQLFQRGGTPAFADFNQDGIPEVYIHNSIFNARTGVKLADGGNNAIGRQMNSSSYTGTISVAGQMDEDSTDLELAAGYTVYKVRIINPNGIAGNNMIAHNIILDNELRDGFTSVADINKDGRLDIIVASAGMNDTKLYCYTFNNGITSLLSSVTLNDSVTRIGPPLIGDLNGNGQLSIITVRPNKLMSFSYNGSIILSQEWNVDAQDISGFTGLTLFDFNNDGKKEIIYRDEGFVRIINVETNLPKELAKIFCPVNSLQEGPIVGDLDNSGHSKICVSCALASKGNTGKLTIFGPPDSLPGWAPARSIWNQYNYHVLNINDDLTVPRVQKNNATYKNGKYNNFYVQESLLDENGMYLKKAASLNGKIHCVHYNPLSDQYTVIFDIYNMSDASKIAESNLPVSFYNGDPEFKGTLIDIYFTKNTINPGDSLLNLRFTFSASDLKRLVMVVNTNRNDNGAFDPKDFYIPECDYSDNAFHILDLPVINVLDTSICQGSIYLFYDTLIYIAGRYYHTISSFKGCDSLIQILDLEFTDTVHSSLYMSSCDSFLWNGIRYDVSGDYSFQTVNSLGCDSILTLHLEINYSSNSTSSLSVCDRFSWNGNEYLTSGDYYFYSQNMAGCDSVATLHLTITNSDSLVVHHTACNSYFWNGKTYTESGVYPFYSQNINSCDSIVYLYLIIDTVIRSQTSQTACESYTWNNIHYTQSGTYQYITQSSSGCDSIATLILEINKSSNSTTKITACDKYIWNGKEYTTGGIYQFVTLNSLGCDSIVTLDLEIIESSSSITDTSSCDIFIWNAKTYSNSGSYQYHTFNTKGCDSIAHLNLKIYSSDSLLITQNACDHYDWNGRILTQSGTYMEKSKNIYSCDSTIFLNLNILKSTHSIIDYSVCDSLEFLGQTFDKAGSYQFTLQNSAGCDSIITLSLSILSHNQINTGTACDSFYWNVNGKTYQQSGLYKEQFINQQGCDSILTLELKINNSKEIVQETDTCSHYIWPVNNWLLTKSDEYTYPLKTIAGCDSILKLKLTVHPDYYHIDTVITSDDYTWTINHLTYTSSGTYEEKFTSTIGCDSIHILYLIIDKEAGIYYPNVINPSSTLNNKFTLFVYGSAAIIQNLSIYDRWGNQIWQKQDFEPNDIHLGWNGKFKEQKVVPGVYVWHAKIILQNGEKIIKRGNLTVVR
jgi:hypothetical protein